MSGEPETVEWEPVILDSGKPCYPCELAGPNCPWHGMPDEAMREPGAAKWLRPKTPAVVWED